MRQFCIMTRARLPRAFAANQLTAPLMASGFRRRTARWRMFDKETPWDS